MEEVRYKLKKTRVYRGGAMASNLQFEDTDVEVSAESEGDVITMRLQLASKGGGATAVRVDLSADDFGRILRAISTVHPLRAAKLYSSELQRLLTTEIDALDDDVD
jgi:hypothetical protein